MELKPESKEQIRVSKRKQKDILVGCDKAIADIQSNLEALQEAMAMQNDVKKKAQDTLNELDSDFPDVVDAIATTISDEV